MKIHKLASRRTTIIVCTNLLRSLINKIPNHVEVIEWLEENDIETKLDLSRVVRLMENIAIMDCNNDNSKYYVFSLLRQNFQDLHLIFENFNIISQKELKPVTTTIPTIYFYEVHGEFNKFKDKLLEKTRAEDPSEKLKLVNCYKNLMQDPKLMYYDFIVKFFILKDLFTKQSIEKFINDNKSKLDDIRGNFAIHEPKFLGAGVDGAAFSIGNQKVLKLFFNKGAYEELKKSQQRLHNSPALAKTEAQIYEVDTIGVIQGLPIYYSIIEEMQAVSDKPSAFKNIIHEIKTFTETYLNADLPQIYEHWLNTLNILSNVPKEIKNKYFKDMIHDQVIIIMNDVINNKSADIEYINNTGILQKDWLKIYIEEMLVKKITLGKNTDLHVGNLGITNQGYLRYFDAVYDRNG